MTMMASGALQLHGARNTRLRERRRRRSSGLQPAGETGGREGLLTNDHRRYASPRRTRKLVCHFVPFSSIQTSFGLQFCGVATVWLRMTTDAEGFGKGKKVIQLCVVTGHRVWVGPPVIMISNGSHSHRRTRARWMRHPIKPSGLRLQPSNLKLEASMS